MAGPWYAHFPGDYERKTSHLTMLEDGAYRRLLDHYYATGIALPLNTDHLYRICRAFCDEERNAIDAILKQYFFRKRDGYHNKRADEEIAEAERLMKIKAEAGRRGGIAARGKSGRKRIADVIANELQNNTPSPSPSPSQKPDGKISALDREPRAEKARSPRKSKTSLPDHFPDDEARRRAQEVWSKKGRPDLAASVLDEMEHFRDHHLKLDNRFADWSAAWRTWQRTALRHPPKVNGHGRRESPHEQSERIARELVAEDAGDTGANPGPSGVPRIALRSSTDERH